MQMIGSKNAPLCGDIYAVSTSNQEPLRPWMAIVQTIRRDLIHHFLFIGS